MNSIVKIHNKSILRIILGEIMIKNVKDRKKNNHF